MLYRGQKQSFWNFCIFPDIKIITGIRRSGKSKLMQAYIAYLKSNFENINIIFIDFMDLAYEETKE